MTDQQAFESLKVFFETRPACRLAAAPLQSRVEIGIVINKTIECAFYKENDLPKFAQRPAQNPDVIFHMNTASVESLINDNSEDIAELGVNVVKNYLAGNVKMKVPGSTINLLTRGYIGVIKAGGLSFGKFLASHGISGLGKIKDFIHKVRRDT